MNQAGAVAAAEPLALGQVLEGKYRVARMLGSGAMGVVYEGYHLLLEKAVAIKVLRPEMAVLDEVRERFEAEARAAAAMGHPNIVTVTDMGRTPEGALYFVMDRLRGETLGERLARLHRLDVAALIPMATDVLSGLEAAHALRLVHRDLKPDNIFMTKLTAGREIAKILDFGVAKALASVGKRATGTQVGLTVGTPLYMAPEQAAAAADIDGRADIYAMGVILYQCLAGRPPFEGNDPLEVLTAVLSGAPPALSSLCPNAPPALVQLIESAMNRDRNLRPATAGEFGERFVQAVAGQGARAVAPSPGNASVFSALGAATLDDMGADPIRAPMRPTDATMLARSHTADLPAPVAPPPPIFQDPVIETVQQAPPAPKEPPGPAAPRPPSSLRRFWWVLVAVPVVAAAIWAAPHLKALLPASKPAKPAREMVLVLFDVTPKDSQLYLDGEPLAANPTRLGKGEVHTVNAVLQGYEMAVKKFFIDDEMTITLKLERKRQR